MTPIDLDRRFVEWKKADNADPEMWARYRMLEGTLQWSDLLRRRRVVVLAEGGSGKSVEFIRQTQYQRSGGLDAWYLTVQSVGVDGIEGSLAGRDRAIYKEWKVSDRPGWFFIDSIDEAKLNRMRFDKALRQVSIAIAGAERRAHILISGRHTDWEFQRDLERLNDELPIPAEHAIPAPPTSEERLISILRHERNEKEDSPHESGVVVVMVGLDSTRVRRFAESKGISNVELLLLQIENANLWDFARRPLDLGWLVDFWRAHGRLGSLTETLETSLTERLKEPDPHRERLGTLESTRAAAALERLGAAMVFGRHTSVEIPDSEVSFEERGLRIEDVLPDYVGAERTELLTRAAFDPATFGRARLHNDNLGVVRSFLSARWLRRLRDKDLSARDMFDLIFGDSYGVQVIRPSIRETAAWLSIWDRDVAREVARREPWVLLTGGDPASLPADARQAVLTQLAERIVADNLLLPPLDQDSLKRFSTSELSTTIRTLWRDHPDHSELGALLLRLIWLGELTACADLAEEVSYRMTGDRRLRLLGARALLAAGDESMKSKFGQFVLSHLAEFPNSIIFATIECLFPSHIGLDELLTVTASIDITDADGGLGFEWQGPDLVARLESENDIQRLLRGLLNQLGGRTAAISRPPNDREEAYFPTIVTLACRLLERSRDEEAPPLAIETALRVGQEYRGASKPFRVARKLFDQLLSTAPRRRVAFWQAAQTLNGHPFLSGRKIEDPFQMRILGWAPQLTAEDIDWLLADGPTRSLADERRLAVNAALDVWRNTGFSEAVLARVRAVAIVDAVMSEVFEDAVRERTRSPEQTAQEAEIEELQRRNSQEQDRRDQSWKDFISDLRANPAQLRDLRPVTDRGVDSRLFYLWQLLSYEDNGKNRYAIDTVAPLEPIAGTEVCTALRDALIAFWRNWSPRLASMRPATERNVIHNLDCMGITGITLEAQSTKDWATRLTSAEATLAAGYATLELNGFPSWLGDLAETHPEEVRAVLRGEVTAEITEDAAGSHFKNLQNLSHADSRIKDITAPLLFNVIKGREVTPEPALAFMLEIVGERLRGFLRDDFLAYSLDRFREIKELPIAALYVAAAFAVDSGRGTDALSAKLDGLAPAEKTELVTELLPRVFGDRSLTSTSRSVSLTFSCLERLVRIAYSAVQVSEDRQHPSGTAYSPDLRDQAEWARNAALKKLVDTPGHATYSALLRFADMAGLPISKERLKSIAADRAAQDSEHDAWPASEARAFEDTFQTAPRTALDMQRLAVRRMEDVQHDLLHADFAQGRNLQALGTDEKAVQLWVADRLDSKKGRSYSVDRESRVVDEKSPDIRLRAKASTAILPIEIKVVDSWSLTDLESALVDQLCGKYLRAKDARYGVLLLVHQQPRSRGWEVPLTGLHITFETLVRRLRNMAARIARQAPDAPQAVVAVLDVSSLA